MFGLSKFFIAIILISTIAIPDAYSTSKKMYTSLYLQDVFLEKYNNNITQATFRLNMPNKNIDYYMGIYFDNDNKSNKNITYTDKQVSPLIGVQSKLLIPSFPIRFFAEARDINRIGNFPDKRSLQSNEVRVGGLGYNYFHFGQSNFFNEHYFAIFYSQLYDHKILAQGWDKTGYRISFSRYKFDLFNELLGDSFDFTKQKQMTTDLRPGVRFHVSESNFTIQLLVQQLIPIDRSGRPNETRATFVFYITN